MLHLKNGNPEPTVNPDKFTLYDLNFCPYCQRVRFALDYHQIPYDRVLINITSKPDWYLKLQPEGRVPLLCYKGETYVESDVIMKFVDQFKGANSSLLSICGEENFKKALDLVSNFARPKYVLLNSAQLNQADVDAFKAAFQAANDAIIGPYLYGEKLSLADLAFCPFLNGLAPVLRRIQEFEHKTPSPAGNAAIMSAWPKLVAYQHLMAEKPFVKATAYSDADYDHFIAIHLANNADGNY